MCLFACVRICISYCSPSVTNYFATHNTSDGYSWYYLLVTGSDQWCTRSSCVDSDISSGHDPFNCMVRIHNNIHEMTFVFWQLTPILHPLPWLLMHLSQLYAMCPPWWALFERWYCYWKWRVISWTWRKLCCCNTFERSYYIKLNSEWHAKYKWGFVSWHIIDTQSTIGSNSC